MSQHLLPSTSTPKMASGPVSHNKVSLSYHPYIKYKQGGGIKRAAARTPGLTPAAQKLFLDLAGDLSNINPRGRGRRPGQLNITTRHSSRLRAKKLNQRVGSNTRQSNQDQHNRDVISDMETGQQPNESMMAVDQSYLGPPTNTGGNSGGSSGGNSGAGGNQASGSGQGGGQENVIDIDAEPEDVDEDVFMLITACIFKLLYIVPEAPDRERSVEYDLFNNNYRDTFQGPVLEKLIRAARQLGLDVTENIVAGPTPEFYGLLDNVVTRRALSSNVSDAINLFTDGNGNKAKTDLLVQQLSVIGLHGQYDISIRFSLVQIIIRSGLKWVNVVNQSDKLFHDLKNAIAVYKNSIVGVRTTLDDIDNPPDLNYVEDLLDKVHEYQENAAENYDKLVKEQYYNQFTGFNDDNIFLSALMITSVLCGVEIKEARSYQDILDCYERDQGVTCMIDLQDRFLSFTEMIECTRDVNECERALRILRNSQRQTRRAETGQVSTSNSVPPVVITSSADNVVSSAAPPEQRVSRAGTHVRFSLPPTMTTTSVSRGPGEPTLAPQWSLGIIPPRFDLTQASQALSHSRNSRPAVSLPTPTFIDLDTDQRHQARAPTSRVNNIPVSTARGTNNLRSNNIFSFGTNNSDQNYQGSDTSQQSFDNFNLYVASQTQKVISLFKDIQTFYTTVSSSMDPANLENINKFLALVSALSRKITNTNKCYQDLHQKGQFSPIVIEFDGKDEEVCDILDAIVPLIETYKLDVEDRQRTIKGRQVALQKSLASTMKGLEIKKIFYDHELLSFFNHIYNFYSETSNTDICQASIILDIKDKATPRLGAELKSCKTLKEIVQRTMNHIVFGSSFLNGLIAHFQTFVKPVMKKDAPAGSWVRSVVEILGVVLEQFRLILTHRSLFECEINENQVLELELAILDPINKLPDSQNKKALFFSKSKADRANFFEKLEREKPKPGGATVSDRDLYNNSFCYIMAEGSAIVLDNSRSVVNVKELETPHEEAPLKETDFVYRSHKPSPWEGFKFLVVLTETYLNEYKNSIPLYTSLDNRHKDNLIKSRQNNQYRRATVNTNNIEVSEIDTPFDLLNINSSSSSMLPPQLAPVTSLNDQFHSNNKVKNNNKISPLQQQQRQQTPSVNNNVRKDLVQCPLPQCNLKHTKGALWNCQLWKSMNINDRWSQVKDNSVCFTCLQRHNDQECKSVQKCKICGAGHNTMLHRHPVTNTNMASIVEINDEEDDLTPAAAAYEDFYSTNNVNDEEVEYMEDHQTRADADTPGKHLYINRLINEGIKNAIAARKQSIDKTKTKDDNDTGCDEGVLKVYVVGGEEDQVHSNTLTSNVLSTGSTQVKAFEPNDHILTPSTSGLGSSSGQIFQVSPVMHCETAATTQQLGKGSFKQNVSSNCKVISTFNKDLNECKIDFSNVKLKCVYDLKCNSSLYQFKYFSPNNKQFFQKVLPLCVRIFNNHCLRLLNYCVIRIVVGGCDEYNECVKRMSHLKDTHVDIYKSHTVLYCVALCDSGACGVSCNRNLLDAINAPKLAELQFLECTPHGSKLKNDVKRTITILDDHGQYHVAATVSLDFLGHLAPVPDTLIDIIAADLGVTRTFLLSNVGIFRKKIQPLIIIGNNYSSIRYQRVSDFRELGLPRNCIFNPNISITHTPFAADRQYILSGSFGIDPDTVDLSNDCPVVRVDSDLSEEDIQKTSDKITSILDSYCLMIKPDDDSVTTCHLDDARVEHFTAAHQPPDSAPCDTYESDFQTDHDCHSDHYFLDDDMIRLYDVNGSILTTCYTSAAPFMTKSDCSLLSEFILSELSLILPESYCEKHTAVLRDMTGDCDNCIKSSISPDKYSHHTLYKEIWNNLYTKPVGDGKYKIFQRMVFLHDPEVIGSLACSNILDAKKSSERLVKKLIAMDALDQADDQIREREERQELRGANIKEYKGIADGTISCQWIRRNIVVKPSSSSTKVRLIADSSIPIRLLNTTLSNSNRCPRFNLNNLANLMLNMFIQPVFVSLDLQRAYLTICIEGRNQYLFATYWFEDPQKYGTSRPRYLFSQTLEFGFGSASTSLGCAIYKYVLPCIKIVDCREQIAKQIFVDNMDLYFKCLSLIVPYLKDVDQAMNKYSFTVSKYFASHQTLQACPELQEYLKTKNYEMPDETVMYGMTWSLLDDRVRPYINTSIYPKHRGAYSGPNLWQKQLKPEDFSRRVISRLVSSLFCPTGRYLAIIIAIAKLFLNKVCQVSAHNQLDVQIITVDPDLANELARFWNKFATMELVPIPRAVVKENEKIIRIICSHDAGTSLMGANVYVVTELNSALRCTLLSAKSCLVVGSIPINELRSRYLAIKLLAEVILAIFPNIHRINGDLIPDVVVVNDNIASTYIFQKNPNLKSVLSRNTRHRCESYMNTIMSLYPNIKFSLCWLPGSMITADFITKYHANFPDLVFSKKWVNGDEIYLSEDVDKFCFLKASQNKFYYKSLPVIKEYDPKNVDFGKLVKDNPHGGPEDADLVPQVQLHHLSEQHLTQSLGEQYKGDHDWFLSSLESSDMTHSVFYENVCFVDYDVLQNPEASVRTSMTYSHCPMSMSIVASDLVSSRYHVNDLISKHSSTVETAIESDTAMTDVEWKDKIMTLVTNQVKTRSAAKIKKLSKLLGICDDSEIYFNSKFLNCSADTSLCFATDIHIDLTQQQYCNMISRQRNIIISLNGLCKAIEFVATLKRKTVTDNVSIKLDRKSVRSAAWRSLIIADQKYFGLKSSKHEVVVSHNIQCLRDRNDHQLLPLLSSDSPLLRNMIWTYHVGYIKSLPFLQLHAPYKTVYSKLLTSELKVFAPRLKKSISETLRMCSGCKLSGSNPTRYLLRYGPALKYTDMSRSIFSQISCDIVGKFVIKPHKQARAAKLSVYLLFVVCLNSSCVDIVIMDGITAQDVIRAITHLEYKNNCKVTDITSDQGSQLSESLLTENKTLPFQVKQVPSKAQYRNTVETKIKLWKNIYKKMFKKYKSSGAYVLNLTPTEFSLILESISLTMNSVPYVGGQFFSPAQLKYSPTVFNVLEEEQMNEGTSMKKYSEFLKELNNVRNETLIQMKHEQLKQQFHLLPGQGTYLDVKPQPNDIVLHESGGTQKLCRVVKLLSDHDVLLQTPTRQFTAAVRNLVIVTLA